MAMKASAKRTSYYYYPVELVWKALGTGGSREVDPLDEDSFENTEPAPNTVFTKSLEVKTNEVFSFRMKARGFIADLRVEMKQTGPCETKVVFSEQVEYRTVSSYLLSRFGLSIRNELKDFSRVIHQRLEDMKT